MLFSLISNGRSLTPDRLDTIIPWWSFTKTALAATALSLVRDGLVKLDDPVPGELFTMRQLLRHEAGLADYGELAEYHTAVASHEPAWPAAEDRLHHDLKKVLSAAHDEVWEIKRRQSPATALDMSKVNPRGT
jgi:CubicO group peptidase (beta-lactamase class C family)